MSARLVLKVCRDRQVLQVQPALTPRSPAQLDRLGRKATPDRQAPLVQLAPLVRTQQWRVLLGRLVHRGVSALQVLQVLHLRLRGRPDQRVPHQILLHMSPLLVHRR